MALRVANLIAAANDIQARLTALSLPQPDRGLPELPRPDRGLPELPRPDRGLGECRERIRDYVRKTEAILALAGFHDQDLSAPSRRAYGWLRFLAGDGVLETHLEALSRMNQALTAAASAFKVEFYHTATLWKVRSEADGSVRLVASEAFIEAPPAVLSALAKLAIAAQGRHRPSRRRSVKSARAGRAEAGQEHREVLRNRILVRQYAGDPAFVRILRALEYGPGGAPGDAPAAGPEPVAADWTKARSRTRGSTYDLEEVFRRVNSAYFGGRVERPFLTWSAVMTRRKLGHYQPGTDTVMVSLTLDDPAIPAHVVDFIMYHELLHKTLGVTLVNGRQRAHTAAFRRAERQFPGYEEVQEFLRNRGPRSGGATAAGQTRSGRLSGRKPHRPMRTE